MVNIFNTGNRVSKDSNILQSSSWGIMSQELFWLFKNDSDESGMILMNQEWFWWFKNDSDEWEWFWWVRYDSDGSGMILMSQEWFWWFKNDSDGSRMILMSQELSWWVRNYPNYDCKIVETSLNEGHIKSLARNNLRVISLF